MRLPRQQLVPVGFTGRPDAGCDDGHVEDAGRPELLQTLESEIALKLEDPGWTFDHVRPDIPVIPVDLVCLRIGLTEVGAAVADDLHGLEDQEVVLGEPGEVVDVFHVQHQASLAVLVKNPEVVAQGDGADDHAGRVNGLGDLGIQQTVVVVEQLVVLFARPVRVCVELLFDLRDLRQAEGVVFPVRVLFRPLFGEVAADVVDDALALTGAEGGDPCRFVRAEALGDVSEDGRPVGFHAVDVDVADLLPVFVAEAGENRVPGLRVQVDDVGDVGDA